MSFPGTSSSLPQSLLDLSEIIRESRHSKPPQQHGMEPRRTRISEMGGHDLLAQHFGFHGDQPGPSSLTSVTTSSLQPFSTTAQAHPKPVEPVLKTSSGEVSKPQAADMAPRNVPVDLGDFPKILSLLKREDRLVAEFAAGRGRDPTPSPLNFDLLTSVFRGSESTSVSSEGQQAKSTQSLISHETSDQATLESGTTGSSSDAAVSRTGLKLAQYTLESVPESRGTQYRVSARLLELLSSAKKTLSKKKTNEDDEQMLVDLSFNSEQPGPSSGKQPHMECSQILL